MGLRARKEVWIMSTLKTFHCRNGVLFLYIFIRSVDRFTTKIRSWVFFNFFFISNWIVHIEYMVIWTNSKVENEIIIMWYNKKKWKVNHYSTWQLRIWMRNIVKGFLYILKHEKRTKRLKILGILFHFPRLLLVFKDSRQRDRKQ